MTTTTAAAVCAVLGALVIAGRPATAVACQCERLDPAEQDARSLANKDVVFDGWVIGRAPLIGTCPMPSAPSVKRGCVRIRVHQRPSCTPMTFPTARLSATDGGVYVAFTASDDGVSEICGMKKGRYVLHATSQQWLVEPDGTPENGIVIDFDPKTGHTLSAVALPAAPWVVVPVTVWKGTVAGQELVTSGAVCPSGVVPFTAYRFAVSRLPGGTLELPSCGVRELSEDEIKTMVRPPAPPAPPAPPPTAATPPPPAKTPPRSSSSCGGCSSGAGTGWLAALLVLGFMRVIAPRPDSPRRRIHDRPREAATSGIPRWTPIASPLR